MKIKGIFHMLHRKETVFEVFSVYYLLLTYHTKHICGAQMPNKNYKNTKITIILWESKFTRFYGGDDSLSY